MRRARVGIGIDRHRGDPHLRAVRMTRQAISPRLAIRIFLNIIVSFFEFGLGKAHQLSPLKPAEEE